MYSYLQLGNDRFDARDMMALDLNADVVVLSACETGRSGNSGDGIVGITWALEIAGVPTTVASQWKVESASTNELMVRFHRALRERLSSQTPGASKAKALQQAALSIMRMPEYRHPFYWSAFVMVGNGF
jgi:CHAT domain-containing protein